MNGRRGVLPFVFLALPVVAAAQQSAPAGPLPLVITDKQAVDEWSRDSKGQQPLDPKAPADTQLLMSLNDTERVGAFRFRQRCAICHGRQMSLAPNTWGPLLSKANVQGKEEAVRQRIMEGSARMPAFKYALQPSDINAIIDYMKKLDNP